MENITICKTSDLNNGESVSFEFKGSPCFITQKDDRYYAYKNACPHLGVNMEWQANNFLDADKELIQCSMHGALFVIESGECVYGPCQGKALAPIAIREQNGLVLTNE